MVMDTSILPSVTTLVIIGLGIVRAAPFMQYEPLQDWSNDVYSHQDFLGSVHKRSVAQQSPINPIQTLLCMKRKCTVHNEAGDIVGVKDCTWQMCRSSLNKLSPTKTMTSSFPAQSQQHDSMTSFPESQHDSMASYSESRDDTMMSFPVESSKNKMASLSQTTSSSISTNIFEEEEEMRTDKHLLVRRKRWQYADALQVCIAQKCQGLKEVRFYQCVYKKCIGHE